MLDRVATREWALDLSEAGKAKSPKLRPANRRRQRIVSFVGRNGDMECCEVRSQANVMLSARDFAEEVARSFSFTAPRRRLIWISTAAFILSDVQLRSPVRTWNMSHHGYSAASARGAYLACQKKAKAFASKLVDDMQGVGSEIFG